MTEEERIFSGGLFSSEEPELVEKKQRAHRLSRAYTVRRHSFLRRAARSCGRSAQFST